MKGLLKYIVALIICIFITCSWHHYQCDHYDWNMDASQQYTILSLKTGSNIQGSFILGTGSINDIDYYIFYRKTIYGGIVREKLPCDKCVIYQGYSFPHIIEYGSMEYHILNGKKTDSTFHADQYPRWKYELYVPSGTITETIKLD